MIYFSPTPSVTVHTKPVVSNCPIGAFESLGSKRISFALNCQSWVLDNGRFSYVNDKPSLNPNWTEGRWVDMLSFYPHFLRRRCVFSCVPDLPCNAEETTKLYYHYQPILKSYGYRCAFVLQDGHSLDRKMKGMIQNGMIDAVFVGGSVEYKYSKECFDLCTFAQSLGVWAHVGRVNTVKRVEDFSWADSVDGTTWAIDPSFDNQRRIKKAVAHVNNLKAQGFKPSFKNPEQKKEIINQKSIF